MQRDVQFDAFLDVKERCFGYFLFQKFIALILKGESLESIVQHNNLRIRRIRDCILFLLFTNLKIRRIRDCIIFLLFLLMPSLGFARGDGIAVGSRGSFHPRLYTSSGYDTNIFHRPDANQAPQDFSPVAAAYFNVRPGLQLKLPSHPIGFYLSGYANYSYYFENLASNLNILTAKADLKLELFKESSVSFTLENNFSRNSGDIITSNEVFENLESFHQLGTAFSSAFLTHNNITKAMFTIQPGGKAFRVDLGYRFRFEFFGDDFADNNRHRIFTNVEWNFFPKTSLVFDAQAEIVNFHPRFNFNRLNSLNQNGMPVKGMVGIVGNFTERLILSARVGGGYTFISTETGLKLDDNYGMAIGDITLTYYLTPTTFLRIGGLHNFHPSIFSNYYHETLGLLSLHGLFADKFKVLARVKGGFIGYGKMPEIVPFGGQLGSIQFNAAERNEDGTISRGDFVVLGNLGFDWNIQKWLTLGILAGIEWRNSNLFQVTPQGQLGYGFFALDAGVKLEFAY